MNLMTSFSPKWTESAGNLTTISESKHFPSWGFLATLAKHVGHADAISVQTRFNVFIELVVPMANQGTNQATYRPFVCKPSPAAGM